MNDTKWERIAAHVEAAPDSDYVNTVKAWLTQYQTGELILGQAQQHWKATHPTWYQTLLEVCMGSGSTKLPKPPADTTEGSPGDKDNKPVE